LTVKAYDFTPARAVAFVTPLLIFVTSTSSRKSDVRRLDPRWLSRQIRQRVAKLAQARLQWALLCRTLASN
jgi:hypothetical protein